MISNFGLKCIKLVNSDDWIQKTNLIETKKPLNTDSPDAELWQSFYMDMVPGYSVDFKVTFPLFFFFFTPHTSVYLSQTYNILKVQRVSLFRFPIPNPKTQEQKCQI